VPRGPSHVAEPATLGRYRLVRKLAVGGMAEIWLAQMSSAGGFEKNVVLKRMLPQLAEDEDLYRMFVDEARIAASLQHPHIVQVYDCGEVDGEFFITMEYLDGADLQTVRAALAQRKAGLPLMHTIHIASAIAAGLHYAHERRAADGAPLGIVHRDVSPANVFVTRDGGIKLLDFGIAKAVDRMTRTSRGALKGKIAYLSPEQVAGDEIDRRSDVYALGVLLFELTTGRRLHAGKSEYQALKDIVEGATPRPSEHHARYPAELEAIVTRAMAKRPAERFQSARELGQALDAFARERRLILSSIGLAEYLGPVIDEARGFADARIERMRERVRAVSDPPPARPVTDGTLDAVVASLGEASGSHAAPAPTAAPLRRLVPGTDPDDPLSAVSQVHVDLSQVDLSRVELRRKLGPIGIGAVGAAVAGAVFVLITVIGRSRPAPTEGLAPPAPPPTGALAIRSSPPGAAIWLSLGRTPVDSPLLDPKGRYRVRVEHDGYVPVELTAEPAAFRPERAGPVAALAAELVPIPARGGADAVAAADAPAGPSGLGAAAARTGHLRVTANKDAAAVWLELGRTPARFDGLAIDRRYELRIALPGHTPYYRVVEPRDLTSDADGVVTIDTDLRPAPASAPASPPDPPARRRPR
jgi:tRNA A-37 threonylcarbamoyl transferase component Bud32